MRRLELNIINASHVNALKSVLLFVNLREELLNVNFVNTCSQRSLVLVICWK